MKVYYNNYNAVEPQAAGASLFYSEFSKILAGKREKHIQFIPFHLEDLLKGKLNLENLTQKDCVICGYGPFAWVFHCLREKNNWNFRIVRDVQTALHSSYIFQEWLCSFLTQKGDQILFPSEYCKQLFIKLFPDSLNFNNTFVCYPMLGLSRSSNRKKKENKGDKELVLGWIGRVSKDKNFIQAVDIFCEVFKRTKSKKVKMLVLGPVINNEFQENHIKEYITNHGGDSNSYHHIGKGKFVSANIKFETWDKIDIFLFPSLANHESLGRVLLEASSFSTPVLAVDHGAAYSIIPKKNLLKPTYFNQKFDLTRIEGLGRIDIKKASEMIINDQLETGGFPEGYKHHDRKIIDIILDKVVEKKQKLDPGVARFIDGVEIDIQSDSNLQPDEICKKAFQFLKKEKKIDIAYTNHGLINLLEYRVFAKVKN